MSWNDTVIEELRAGKPRIADMFDRENLLLLHTTGARTGEPRISPVAYFEEGDRLFVVASKAGAPTHPAWFHNLVANSTVRTERWVDDRLVTAEATARPLESAEREGIWSQITARAPGFAQYQEKTDRVIPVVELRPAG